MQIFMASTYPLEIVEAHRWVQKNGGLTGHALDEALKAEDWDASVKSLCAFPQVLKQLSENLDWTQDMGDAFLGQKTELLDAVQRMRNKASDAGNLKTTEQQTVTVNPDKTIIIPSLQTVGNQADRSFNVVLTPGAGITLGSPGTTTVTIQDDDIPAESNVRFDVTKLVVLETVGTAVLTLHRELTGPSPSFARDVTVKYSTVAGTALATSDYIAVANGTVHWGPGDSADKTISITIVNNAVAEPTESFKVVLSAPTAGLGFANNPPEATISILDDDEAFPLDGVIPAGFSQAVGATKSWHVSNDPGAYEGAFTLKEALAL